jgi:NOT2 / NOT3 / NOT5 family
VSPDIFLTISDPHSHEEICIRHLLHHGQTNRPHGRWSQIFTCQAVISMCKHHLLARPRLRRSAMRRYSSCSIQVRGMRCRKSPRKNCAYLCFYAFCLPDVVGIMDNLLTIHYSWNRNWRYHKDLRQWITKETGTTPSQKVPGGEQGRYTFWDPDNWAKERKEMNVMYADLEEKNVPAFVPALGLVPTQAAAQVGQQPTQVSSGQQQAQVQQPTTRGSFQMGMAGL